MVFNDTLNARLLCPYSCLQARVKPSCGRLVGFSSGPVNPHGVTAVTRGRRCALALWFTKEKLYRDMVYKTHIPGCHGSTDDHLTTINSHVPRFYPLITDLPSSLQSSSFPHRSSEPSEKHRAVCV
ncbi:hypothetical protein GOODEAATRI_011507 [Goodea atripinnis]|uniref:Uncharacterized protein n=1 Tax=Goodea atripinnis TaxID=208336 RepID=A0ABV0NTN8_9TELE